MADVKGIFVRGFHQVLTQHELKEFFEAFGEIEDIILNKRQMYAIIEFRESASADLVLSREIFLKGRKLKIARRKPQILGPEGIKANSSQVKNQVANTSEKEDVISSLVDVLSLDNFDSQIMKFVKEVEVIGMKRKVELICISLQKSVRPHFPGCKILPFGSSVTGLSSKESDVDIYIDIGDWKTEESEFSPSNLVMLTRKILNNSEFMKCICIPKARVPILKCFHKLTQLNCDINFQNALGIFNSELIKFYLSLEPQLRVLIIFIKSWAKNNHLCGPGRFTSYALVMLFLFFMQQMPNNNIPTVEVLQKNCKIPNIVQEWDCRFDNNPRNYHGSGKRNSLIKILSGFFRFYADFEFERNIVIMNYGASVPREHFSVSPENSLCFRYRLALQRNNVDSIDLDHVMCVLDPFLLSHNITASVGLRAMNQFQIRCFKSAEVCQKIESGESGYTFETIFALQFQGKKIKFPYVESLKDGYAKFIIPLKGFNPQNLFETSECEISCANRSSLMQVLIFQLKQIFDKILRLSVVKEEIHDMQFSSDRKQIAKMENMEDVHSDDGSKIVHPMTLHLSGIFNVWNGRGPTYKEFSFPKDMMYMEKEMHVTNYIVDTFYKGSLRKPQKIDIKCIVAPIMDFRCLEVEITTCNQYETFKPMITFLLTLLNKWL